MKHLLKLEDWSTEEIINTLNLADQLKYEQKHGIEHKILKGKSLGMIFEKSSTRTRVSFEVGMTQLGGYPLFLSSNDLQIGRGEPVEDTARVLSRFLDGIMIRTFEQKEVEALAEYGSIPIINGLTDYCHPCQVLADLMTIREFKGKLEGLKMCFIGDGNNMMNSLIVGALSTGMSFSAACPKDYMPPKHIIEFGEKYGNGKFEIVTDPLEAAKNADIVYTDVWDRKKKRKSVRQHSQAIRLTRSLWLLQTRIVWFSIVSLHTVAKRLLQMYLKNTQMKSLRRLKTVFTLRRLFLLNVWQMKCPKKFDDSLIL